jgi:hypothetical protein
MSELKNIRKKRIYLKGPVSSPGKKVLTSVQVETETPDQTVTESVFHTFDCSHHFDPSKIFHCRWTGKVICQDCTVVCAYCGARAWVEVASKAGSDYFCPDHKFYLFLKILFGGLTARKEEQPCSSAR